jgi:hypothetical protein
LLRKREETAFVEAFLTAGVAAVSSSHPPSLAPPLVLPVEAVTALGFLQGFEAVGLGGSLWLRKGDDVVDTGFFHGLVTFSGDLMVSLPAAGLIELSSKR